MIDRHLLLGPEPYPVEELSPASRERRLLDSHRDEEELEDFREWVIQHQAGNGAWQTRWALEQMLPEVRAELARGTKNSRVLLEFNRLTTELFLLEEEAKLVSHLRPWAYEFVSSPDWEHPATHALWQRFRQYEDEAWPMRKRALQRDGLLPEMQGDAAQ